MKYAKTKIIAFFLGIYEFNSNSTTSYGDESTMNNYDKGRDLAHKLTLRLFDECA